MTEAQAIDLARAGAEKLGWPWGSYVAGRRRRLWPFPARWLIVATDPGTGITTQMVVDEQTQAVWPSSVIYPNQAAVARRELRGLDLLRAATGAAVGILGAWGLGWAWWAGAVLAIPGAMLGLVLLRPRRTIWPGGVDRGPSRTDRR